MALCICDLIWFGFPNDRQKYLTFGDWYAIALFHYTVMCTCLTLLTVLGTPTHKHIHIHACECRCVGRAFAFPVKLLTQFSFHVAKYKLNFWNKSPESLQLPLPHNHIKWHNILEYWLVQVDKHMSSARAAVGPCDAYMCVGVWVHVDNTRTSYVGIAHRSK